jgi:hypothetical protein
MRDMFDRLMRYSGRHFHIWNRLQQFTDKRRRPHHKMSSILCSVLAMHLTRTGSVHALQQTADNAFWQH